MGKNKILGGMFWKFSERILAQLISFTVSLVIARILLPADYGVVSIIFIFISIANVLISNGFSAALIQKKESDELDFSSVFYVGLFFSIIFSIIFYFIAPYVSKFFNISNLTDMFRVLTLIIPLSSYKAVQNAYVSKTMDFKKFFFSTLGGTIFSGVVGIILALKGFGAWALIFQYLSNSLVDAIILTFTIKWKPKLLFSFKSIKQLLPYSINILFSDLIGTVYNNFTAFIIGKKFSSADLAYYNRGKSFSDLINVNISITIASVLFPAMSLKKNKEEICNTASNAIMLSSFFLFPIYFGLMAIGSNLLILLLTEKWAKAVPFLYIICIDTIIGIIGIIDIQIIKAMGKGKTLLIIEIIKKTIFFILVFIGLKFNLIVVACILPISDFIGTIINGIVVDKLINYSLLDKVKDVFKSFLSSVIMFVVVYFMTLIHINMAVLLLLQILIGCAIYIIVSAIIKNENFYNIINKLRRYKNDKKRE